MNIPRISAILSRRRGFVGRVFTDREVADCLRGGVAPTSAVAAARFAARFAAKEAMRKALGRKLSWREVEVRTDADGAPALWVRGAPAAGAVSLAHDGGIAIAVVLVAEAAGHDPLSLHDSNEAAKEA